MLFFTKATPEECREAHATPGRVSQDELAAMGLPTDAHAYICGPGAYMADMTSFLTALGFDADRIHTELFGAAPAITPGIATPAGRPPHQPPGPPATGPLVTFARSGLSTRFPEATHSVLDLADACDVNTRWSCRTGVCHTCETPLLSGEVAYDPDPLEPPDPGDVLICCARPTTDVVLDM
jgi:ferredoxin